MDKRLGLGQGLGLVTSRKSVELTVAPNIASHDINADGYKQHSCDVLLVECVRGYIDRVYLRALPRFV